MTVAAQRAREDGKSSHHARDVLPRECVHGHHIYKRVWTPVVGEKLPVDIEEDDDPRAVAVRTCGIVVGNVPKACSLASSIDEDS